MIKQNKNSYYQNAYYYELFHWFNCMKSDLYRQFPAPATFTGVLRLP